MSVLGLGAVLYQEQDGVEKTISYASQSLTQSEAKYPVHKLECLCLKWAITEQLHEYLYRNTFDVYMDNNPLTYVLSMTKWDAMGHRLITCLTNYNFHIHYKLGKVTWNLMLCLGLIGRNVMRPYCLIPFRQ